MSFERNKGTQKALFNATERTERGAEWETPDAFFRKLDAEFHFTLDAAASAQNTKVPNAYIDNHRNALTVCWSSEALAIAKVLGQLHHIPARQATVERLEKIWDAVHYAPWGNGWGHVVLMDEIDGWRLDLQSMCLSLWDCMGSLDNALFCDWKPQPPKVVWIGTTNQDHRRLKTDSRFEPRFLSRVRVVPFSSYGMAPIIAEYLDHVWHSEGGNGNAPDLLRLVKESRNNIRECLNALESELARL